MASRGRRQSCCPGGGEGGREGEEGRVGILWSKAELAGLVGGSAQPGAQTGASPLGTPRDSERRKADP